MIKLNLNMNKIEELYKTLNLREVAKIMDCNYETIRKRLRERGVNTHKRKQISIDKQVKSFLKNPLRFKFREKKLNNNLIVKLYKKGYSILEISEKFKVTNKVIYRRLRIMGIKLEKREPKYKLPKNSFKILKLDEDKIIKLYVEEKYSLEDISEIEGCSLETVRSRLRKRGIKIRNKTFSRKKFPNKKERILIDLFKKYNLPYKYVGNGKIIIENKNPDFININGEKKVVELFGNYWHSEEFIKKYNKQKISEEYTLNHYKKYGFDCLIIWEKELKNIDQVLGKIRNFESL